MVTAWYDEIKDYDFSGDYQKGTGHFTQVVWKGSTHVGMALSDDGKFCVANYYPGGNVIREFHKNVLPRGSPYVPEEEAPVRPVRRRSSSLSGVRSATEARAPEIRQQIPVLRERRPSYSGAGSKSKMEAPTFMMEADLNNFFKDFSSRQLSGGYSKDGRTTVKRAGYQGDSQMPSVTQRSSRSSSCGGNRSTTTVTKTVTSNGAVVTQTTRTVYSWS